MALAACGGASRSTSDATAGAAGQCAACAANGGQAAAGASSSGAGGLSGAGAGDAGSAGVAGSSAGDSGSAGTAGIAGNPADAGIDAGPAASGLSLSEVSLWQSMRVPLMLASGSAPALKVPIIRDKPGVLRAYVAPNSDFIPRTLRATLTLKVAGATQAFDSSQRIDRASQDGDFTSTFDFALDGKLIALDTSLALEIHETSGELVARYPAQGLAPINGHAAGTKAATLNVVLVPIVLGGVAPDVSPATVQIFHDRLQAMYPVSSVDVSVRAAVASSIAIGPDAGWEQLLDFLYALRASDDPAPTSYYYGLFTPAATFDDYCITSCTVGISQVATPGEVQYRGAIGLDIFPDGSGADAPDTMAHELGHALGRQHAPCDTPDPDPEFPYASGSIGVWGYDSAAQTLLDPQQASDVMSYCAPDWISDYTYLGIYNQLAQVLAMPAARRAPAAGAPFRRVIVQSDGELALGGLMTFSSAPRGTRELISLHDAKGGKLLDAPAYFQPLPDSRGGRSGFLLVAESALKLPGRAALRRGAHELKLH